MERFKIILDRGLSYWEPLTKTNLNPTRNWRIFTDEMIEDMDMSGINYSLQIGTLKKVELNPEPEVKEEPVEEIKEKTTEETVEVETASETSETDKKEDVKEVEVEVTMREKPVEEEEEEEVVLVSELDNEKPRCQEIKSDGTQCVYEAKYPEDDPQFCGIHNKE